MGLPEMQKAGGGQRCWGDGEINKCSCISSVKFEMPKRHPGEGSGGQADIGTSLVVEILGENKILFSKGRGPRSNSKVAQHALHKLREKSQPRITEKGGVLDTN